MNAIRDTRGGRTSDSRFTSRVVGQGARWAAIERLFATQCERLGLDYMEGEGPTLDHAASKQGALSSRSPSNLARGLHDFGASVRSDRR